MSIIRYEIASHKSALVTRSQPGGTGAVLIRVDVETTLAEAGRAHANHMIHSRDVVISAVRQLLQHLVSEAK